MANGTPPSDGSLVRAARGGDSAAAGELIRRHAEGVLTLLARTLLDRELAQDLAQEAFLRVLRSLERFDEARSFRAWLHSIAWNLALDQFRRRKRRGERIGLAFEGGGGDAAEVLPEEPADHREELPAERLERGEERELVQRALGKLSPAHRAALVLRDLEGLSYDEVARALGLRLGTAKSRINRARIEFRDVYLRLSPSLKEELT